MTLFHKRNRAGQHLKDDLKDGFQRETGNLIEFLL